MGGGSVVIDETPWSMSEVDRDQWRSNELCRVVNVSIAKKNSTELCGIG